MLAAAAEGLGCALRIPLGDEAGQAARALNLPDDCILPCFLAVGRPDRSAPLPAERQADLESRLHLNKW